jgi:hypothetical protein
LQEADMATSIKLAKLLGAVALLPAWAQAALVPLAPNTPAVALGGGTTAAADPSLAGTVIKDTVADFFGNNFKGEYQARVVRRDDTGTLDFYYRIREFTDQGTGRVLRDFRIGDFSGWDTSVTWRPDGVPGPGAGDSPLTAIRFPQPQCPACDGINFSFADLAAGAPSSFVSGDESFFMLIRTDARAYASAQADVYLVSVPGVPFGQFLSNPFTVYAPAVPEPETYALMLAGLALMGGVVRRRSAVQRQT